MSDLNALNRQSIDFVIIAPLAEELDALLDQLPGYKRLNPSDDDIQTYYFAH